MNNIQEAINWFDAEIKAQESGYAFALASGKERDEHFENWLDIMRAALVALRNEHGRWEEQMKDCPLKPVEDKEKHGKWVLHGNDDDLGMTYYCSVCGFGLDEDLFYSGYKDGKWIRNHVFKHCPNCGTKMEE